MNWTRDYSVTVILIVSGVILIALGFIMWGGMPAALATAGALLLLVGLLST